jgi:hypothetical protein
LWDRALEPVDVQRLYNPVTRWDLNAQDVQDVALPSQKDVFLGGAAIDQIFAGSAEVQQVFIGPTKVWDLNP